MSKPRFIPWLAAAAGLFVFACADAPTDVVQSDLDPVFAKPGGGGGGGGGGADLVALGNSLFNDKRLSVKGNQSCATCHEPKYGFAAAEPGVLTKGSVVQGSVAGKFGDRKPPSAAYATLSPVLSGSGNSTIGGNFWDGRATGKVLGNPAADQALGPFLNPKEQALPDAACVVWLVRTGSYAGAYTAAWGTNINSISFPSDMSTVCTTPREAPGDYVVLSATDRALVATAYNNIALSIAAFEATFNKFSSRFDKGQLTPVELEGQKLFSGKGKCQQCHANKRTQPLFTDNKYHNLGVPRNPANPVYGSGTSAFDPGLGGFTGASGSLGRFRTPTIRNVGMGEANRTYMHNGSLVSLKQVVDFYNTRDVLPRCTGAALQDPTQWGSFGSARCWPAPEYPGNLDTQNMGNLGLTESQVDAIVAYMRAMTDL